MCWFRLWGVLSTNNGKSGIWLNLNYKWGRMVWLKTMENFGKEKIGGIFFKNCDW